MKRTVNLILCILFIISLAPAGVCAASDITSMNSYYYSVSGKAVSIPAPYYLKTTLDLSEVSGVPISDPVDMHISADGKIYVLDSTDGKIIILNKDFSLYKIVKEYMTADGKKETLSKPEGFFIDVDNIIYLADTENHRIIRCNENGIIDRISRNFEDIEGLDKGAEFLPVKLVVDKSKRVYITARNINMGIMELDNDGNFTTFMGAPRVVPNLVELFWRSISTKAQRDKMISFVPTEYNNLAIDKSGFIYGSISAIDEKEMQNAILSKNWTSVTPIRKLNNTGTDILRRMGNFPPVGDIKSDVMSQIVDVAPTEFGVYSLLDFRQGRIFTYDDDGNMLYAMGMIDNKKDTFVKPVAINYLGQSLCILDADLKSLFVFDTTDYGKKLLNAVILHYNGNYEKADEAWNEVLSYNPSFEQGYVGVGKVLMRQGRYKEAMESFNNANAMNYYGKAFEAYRKETFSKYFGYIFALLISILFIRILVFAGKLFIGYSNRKDVK